MKKVEEQNMTIQGNPTTEQDQQGPKDKASNQRLAEIIDERNRLVRSVMKQPNEVLQDMAILAVGWAMQELAVPRLQQEYHPDLLSGIYRLRVIGLADGDYGDGIMVEAGDDGPKMFDTSACTLLAHLRKYAQIGARQ